MENQMEASQLPAGSVMSPIWVPELELAAVASQPRPGHKVRLMLAFASIYLLWGSTYLAIRYAVATIPPLATAGMRDATAGVILLAVAWIRGFRPRREHWQAGLVVGALFFVVGHSGLNWAEQYVSSGSSALLITTEPIFILVLGWLLGQQRITLWSALGLGLGAMGVALLTGAEFSIGGKSLLRFCSRAVERARLGSRRCSFTAIYGFRRTHWPGRPFHWFAAGRCLWSRPELRASLQGCSGRQFLWHHC